MKKKYKKKAGIIYSVKNEITGEFYIGATTSKMDQRKNDHEQRANSGTGNDFQEAIGTYGVDAFNWEQIDVASDIDELALKEKQYILEYNSKEEGYNADSGGGFKKTVYQYELENGILIEKYDGLQEAALVINATKQDISRACLSINKTYCGFYWSYVYIEPFEPNKDLRKNKVLLYCLKENKIQEFNSVAEAYRKTGVNKSSIAKVCRGERKTAGGFVWWYV